MWSSAPGGRRDAARVRARPSRDHPRGHGPRAAESSPLAESSADVSGSRAVWLTRRSRVGACLAGSRRAVRLQQREPIGRYACSVPRNTAPPRRRRAARTAEGELPRACRRAAGIGEPGHRPGCAPRPPRIRIGSRVFAIERGAICRVGQRCVRFGRSRPFSIRTPHRKARQAPLDVRERTVLVPKRLLTEGCRGVRAHLESPLVGSA